MSNEMQKDNRSMLDRLLDERSPVESRQNKDKMFLSVRIADVIKEKGLSKSSFAAMIGQKPSVVSKWLSGTHNFTTETLSEIAFKLGLTLPELVTEKPAALVYKNTFGVVAMPVHVDRRPFGGPVPGDADIVIQGSDGTMTYASIKTGMIDPATSQGLIWKTIELKDYMVAGMTVDVKTAVRGVDTPPDQNHNYALKA